MSRTAALHDPWSRVTGFRRAIVALLFLTMQYSKASYGPKQGNKRASPLRRNHDQCRVA